MKKNNLIILLAAVAMALVSGVSMVSCNLFKSNNPDNNSSDNSTSNPLNAVSSALVGTWKWEFNESYGSGTYQQIITLNVTSATDLVMLHYNAYYGTTSSTTMLYTYNEITNKLITIEQKSGYGYSYAEKTEYTVTWFGADKFVMSYYIPYYNETMTYGPFVRTSGSSSGSSTGSGGTVTPPSQTSSTALIGTWKWENTRYCDWGTSASFAAGYTGPGFYKESETLIITSANTGKWNTYDQAYASSASYDLTYTYNESTNKLSVIMFYEGGHSDVEEYTLVWFGSDQFVLQQPNSEYSNSYHTYGPFVRQ